MRILMAMDGSDGARAAASWVNENLGESGKTEILLLSVVEHFLRESTMAAAWGAYEFLDADTIAREQEEVEKAAAAMLSEASGLFDAAKFKVETRTVTGGSPAQRIVEAAQEWGADLIVLGSRGLGPWTGMLLGSVSDRVMHTARRPVLVVHPPEDAEAQSRGA